MTCPTCGDSREVSDYFNPQVHDKTCPTCRIGKDEAS